MPGVSQGSGTFPRMRRIANAGFEGASVGAFGVLLLYQVWCYANVQQDDASLSRLGHAASALALLAIGPA